MRDVFSNINLDVHPKEFICLLGPSGCGKSTLLNTIAGFIKPDVGDVTVNDQRVRKPGPDRGFVFQKNSLLPWMTLEENVGCGLKIQGLPKCKYEIRLITILIWLGYRLIGLLILISSREECSKEAVLFEHY